MGAKMVPLKKGSWNTDVRLEPSMSSLNWPSRGMLAISW